MLLHLKFLFDYLVVGWSPMCFQFWRELLQSEMVFVRFLASLSVSNCGFEPSLRRTDITWSFLPFRTFPPGSHCGIFWVSQKMHMEKWLCLESMMCKEAHKCSAYSCRLIFSGLVIHLHSHILLLESKPIFQRSYSILSNSIAMTKNQDADLDS